MGIVLARPDEGLRFSNFFWFLVLNEAEDFGWEPQGTENNEELIRFQCHDLPESEIQERLSGGGGYTSNDHQRVTPDDARTLAEALEKALPSISDDDQYEEIPQFRIADEAPKTQRAKLLGGPVDKEHIREIIKFCQDGEFWLA
jgi:hypothetical protein